MSTVPTHRAFFGDAERDFALPPHLIIELERSTGWGFLAIVSRVFGRECAYAEIAETIRLGLIGGGEAPETAKALAEAYTPAGGLIGAYSIAVEILETALNGQPQPDRDAAEAETPEVQP